MSALAVAPHAADPRLAGDVLAHLEAQLQSTRRLLQSVLAQGAAIRAQDVDGVVRQVAAFQAELERRARLEEDRARLLARAGASLNVAPPAVTLSQLAALMSPHDAQLAHARSAELQGLLAELQREHACNQALMRQELTFLDHLLRLVGAGGMGPGDAGAYTASGIRPAAHMPHTTIRSGPRALDLQA
ncbi:MAG: flagellar export chaperone FlgN [Actinobacteria bacterium]|nr:flagellar export chaperone FlgN [Actinomycetota bacterium]